MGMQVIFYLVKQDAIDFASYLRTKAPTYVLLPTYWLERTIEPITSGLPLCSEDKGEFNGYFIRPEDFKKIQVGDLKSARSGAWYLSTLDHPFIEARLGNKPSKGSLGHSRLYYRKEYGFLRGDKSSEFLKFADTFFKVARRFFKHRTEDRFGYLGEQAHQWISEGEKSGRVLL